MTSQYDSNTLRVPDDQLDYDEELIYYYKGERFTGLGYADVPSHGLSEISYNSGFQDGPARDWYPSGQLKSEAIYWRNVLHGRSCTFGEDGALTSEKVHEYGVLMRSAELDENGELVDTFVLTEDSRNFAILERLRAQYGT